MKGNAEKNCAASCGSRWQAAAAQVSQKIAQGNGDFIWRRSSHAKPFLVDPSKVLALLEYL